MVCMCDGCKNLIIPNSKTYSTIPCPICGTLTVVGSEAKGIITITSPTVDCEIEGSDETVDIKIPNMTDGTEKALQELQKSGWKIKFDQV